MAVNLTSEPSGVKYATDDLKYVLAITAISDATDLKKIQFKASSSDLGGGNVVDLEKDFKGYEPKDIADTIEVNLKYLGGCALGTEVPVLDGLNTKLVDDIFEKEIFLKYGELSINKTTKVITSGEADSTHIRVVNAYEMPWMGGSLTLPAVLTDKEHIEISHDAHDWTRIAGTGIDVTFTFYYENGGTDVQTLLGQSSGLIPTGPEQWFDVSAASEGQPRRKIYKYKVNFFKTGELNKDIWFYVDRKRSNILERVDVYFLEPLGSWSVMSFNMNNEEEIERDIIEICRGGGVAASETELFEKYGRDIVNVRKWMSVSLKKRIHVDSVNSRYVRAFGAARNYRANFGFTVGGNDSYLSPLIPTTTSIKTYKRRDLYEIEFGAIYGMDLY